MVLDRCIGGCPFQESLDLLGKRYALSILWALQQQSPRRFNDFRKELGINPVTLSQRLKEFEAAGLVTRTTYSEIPPRVDYALTPKGYDLLPLIDRVEEWANKWQARELAAATQVEAAA
jgi:DNA-binding HxlR family transcriptional regulator